MTTRNAMSLLLRRSLAPLGMRLVRLTPNKVRGIDPLLDLSFLLARKPNPVIFDVGANDGETAGEFLETFPQAQLVAFEPFAECCELLRSRFADRANVKVENLALGADRGTSRLNLYSGNRMNSLLQLDDRPDNMMKNFSATGTVDVGVDTLDHYCEAHGYSRIDLLKVDTQGFDLQVLKGAAALLQQQRVKAVLLEVNFVPMYKQQASFADLHGFLSSFGYRLVDFYNQQRNEGYTAWCDACYVAPESASS